MPYSSISTSRTVACGHNAFPSGGVCLGRGRGPTGRTDFTDFTDSLGSMTFGEVGSAGGAPASPETHTARREGNVARECLGHGGVQSHAAPRRVCRIADHGLKAQRLTL
jgi:hypothetical protein